MNPHDPIVQTIAKTLAYQLSLDDVVDSIESVTDSIAQPFVDLALAILFDLAKTGVKLVHPDDVIKNESDKDAGTVRLLLKAE